MKQHTATYKSGSGMGAQLKTHVLKGKLTLCGLKPDFETINWSKDKHSFDRKSDCKRCAAKLI